MAINPSVDLSVERLVKLDRVVDPELQNVVDEMRQVKRAGDQEALLEKIVVQLKKAATNSSISE